MGEERPTLDTVARAAGVSRMTVSNAYNRPDQLSLPPASGCWPWPTSWATPARIPAARSLRRRRTGTIGVLLTERLEYAFTDPGMVGLLRGLAGELGAAGQSMLLVPSEADDVGDVVRSALVDAFVVCSMDEKDEAVVAVRPRRLPLVTVGHPRLAGVPFVGIDNVRAAALAAEHLLGLGHRRFGVVGLPGRDPGDTDAPRRAGAHRPARPGRGLPAYDGRQRGARRSRWSTRRCTRTRRACAWPRLLLDVPGRDRPTAVFAVTDVLAFAVLEVAARARPRGARAALGRRVRRHRGGRTGPRLRSPRSRRTCRARDASPRARCWISSPGAKPRAAASVGRARRPRVDGPAAPRALTRRTSARLRHQAEAHGPRGVAHEDLARPA